MLFYACSSKSLSKLFCKILYKSILRYSNSTFSSFTRCQDHTKFVANTYYFHQVSSFKFGIVCGCHIVATIKQDIWQITSITPSTFVIFAWNQLCCFSFRSPFTCIVFYVSLLEPFVSHSISTCVPHPPLILHCEHCSHFTCTLGQAKQTG